MQNGLNTTPAAEIGTKLRRLRKERKLTQTELARQIGIQQSDLSRMEKGEYRVSLDNLMKILAVFDLQIGEFFGGGVARPEPVARSLSSEDMQLLHVLRRLSPEARREVMEFAEFKARREEIEQRARDSRPRSRSGS